MKIRFHGVVGLGVILFTAWVGAFRGWPEAWLVTVWPLVGYAIWVIIESSEYERTREVSTALGLWGMHLYLTTVAVGWIVITELPGLIALCLISLLVSHVLPRLIISGKLQNWEVVRHGFLGIFSIAVIVVVAILTHSMVSWRYLISALALYCCVVLPLCIEWGEMWISSTREGKVIGIDDRKPNIYPSNSSHYTYTYLWCRSSPTFNQRRAVWGMDISLLFVAGAMLIQFDNNAGSIDLVYAAIFCAAFAAGLTIPFMLLRHA